MKKISKLLLSGVLGTVALSAQAAPVPVIQSYSVNSNLLATLEQLPAGQTLNFAQFDSGLGSLQSVTIDLTSTLGGTVKIENKSATTRDYKVTGQETVKLLVPAGSLTSSTSGEVTYTLAKYDGVVDYINASGVTAAFVAPASTSSFVYTDAATLAAFTGTGLYSSGVSVSSTAGIAGSGNFSRSFVTDIGASAVVTYTYQTLPVPEPETYAMLLAGLGLMGAVMRKRKAA